MSRDHTETQIDVVLLHALAVDGRMWDSTIAGLAARGHVAIALHQRGYGGRALGDGDPSIPALAKDVTDDLDRLSIDKCALVGASMGGYIALALLRLYPERFTSLVLISSRAAADDETARSARLRFADAILDPELTSSVTAAALQLMVGDTTRRSRPEIVDHVAQLVQACPPATTAWCQRAIAARSDETSTLRAARIPLTVMAGAEDTLVPPSEAEQLAARVGAHFECLAGVGHLAPVEDPSAVVKVIDSTLRRVTPDRARWGHSSSTGQDFTDAAIVDAHFNACREAYLALLDRVGVSVGATVLDAGCGSGSFLPALAEAVGAQGRLIAVDLAPENIVLTRRNLEVWGLSSHAEAMEATLLQLPLDDSTVDVVWCSNTVQYLDDAQLAVVLAEFTRVLRPGGRLAIKDLDATTVRVSPGDPDLFVDFFRLEAQHSAYARQLLRTADLHAHISRAGFESVHQETLLIEHSAPLSPQEKEFYDQTCSTLAARAMSCGAPGDWAPLLDPHSEEYPLNRPDGYISETNVLVTATAPAGNSVGPARDALETVAGYSLASEDRS